VLEGALNPIQTGMLDLVCQPEPIKTLFKGGKFLLFALLELIVSLSR
jgi:hypothetical protein